jgi:hypothetical protein
MEREQGQKVAWSSKNGNSSSRSRGTGSRSWTPEGPMLPAEWQALPVGDGGRSKGGDGGQVPGTAAPSQSGASGSKDATSSRPPAS